MKSLCPERKTVGENKRLIIEGLDESAIEDLEIEGRDLGMVEGILFYHLL